MTEGANTAARLQRSGPSSRFDCHRQGEALTRTMSKQQEETMKLGDRWNHDLKPDAQAFDEIRLVTVPRYKMSGLSGDEWRISARIEFYRKGRLVHESGGQRNIQVAASFLAYEHARACDDGKGYFAGERDVCDQEGCAEVATVFYQKKANYCREAHKTEPHRPTYRQFCEKHKTRGDCAFDDADANYEAIENPALEKVTS
jgi:hypothetical protein